jgi:hypothetical protein
MLYVVFLVETFLKKSYPEEHPKSQTDGTVPVKEVHQHNQIYVYITIPAHTENRNTDIIPCVFLSLKLFPCEGSIERFESRIRGYAVRWVP